MTLALIAASAFAACAVLLLFALPMAVALPGQRLKRFAKSDMQFMAGCTATLAASAVSAPMIASALISGGENVQTVASYVFAMRFSL